MLTPRTLAEIDSLVFRGELPAFAAAMFGGSHVWQLGRALFVLPDAERYPETARAGVTLRNLALVLGTCPHCGGLRPALAAPAGVGEVRFPAGPARAGLPGERARATPSARERLSTARSRARAQ